MPAPTFDLPVAGSSPNQYATEAGLEEQINDGFTALYSQARNGYQLTGVLRLENVSGDGQAVTGDIPSELVDFALKHGVEFSLVWPATNQAPAPTITVRDVNNVYTMTLQTSGGGQIDAGQLLGGRIYLARMMSNTTARVHGAITGDGLVETGSAVRLSLAMRDKLAALPSGATIASDISNLEAQISALSAASIAGVAGPYATISEGLAAVGNGAQFLVANPGTGRIDLYRRTADMGYYQMEWTQVRDMATRAGLVAAVAAGLTHGDGVTITAGGRQYVASAGATAVPGLPGWLPAGVVTLEHFGAVGDGVTSDQTAFDAARGYGVPIYLPAGKRYLVTDPTSFGLVTKGPGHVVTTVPGGILAYNSPEELQSVHYRHFGHAVKKAIMSSTSIKVVVFGDSTATNGYGINIGSLVTDELENSGIGVASVVMASVAGDAWFSKDLSAILTGYGEQKHVAICKFGINDSGLNTTPIKTALSQMRNAMRQRLSEIRASVYGAEGNLTILLIMPNALGNVESASSNKNNVWLRSIRAVYLEAARDYACVVYDPWAESQWANGQESKSLDIALVHPLPNYNLDIWGRALRETLSPFGSIPRNRFVFRKAAEGFAPNAASGIAIFPKGVSYTRAENSDGYPFNGVLLTEFHPDNVGRQTLIDFTAAYPREVTRHWVASTTSWSSWSGSGGVTSLTLQNGWVDYGGSFGPLVAGRTPDGLVYLSGAIKSGTVTATTTIATLPAGYRPIAEMLLPVATLASPYIGQIRITTAGVISLRVAGDATGMFFNGVSFAGSV